MLEQLLTCIFFCCYKPDAERMPLKKVVRHVSQEQGSLPLQQPSSSEIKNVENSNVQSHVDEKALIIAHLNVRNKSSSHS